MSDRAAEAATLSWSQVEAAAWREVRRPVAIMLTDATGRTQTPLRTTGLTWPGISTVRPEPVAQIEAAHALQTAAHALIGDLIPRAREAGRSWYEIGDALDLQGQAVGANEPVAEVAYDYLLEYQVGTSMRRLTWTCPACHQLITDRGPFDVLPERGEGHACGCARGAAELAEWHEHQRSAVEPIAADFSYSQTAKIAQQYP